jgi:pacifastin inhibitor LCMII
MSKQKHDDLKKQDKYQDVLDQYADKVKPEDDLKSQADEEEANQAEEAPIEEVKDTETIPETEIQEEDQVINEETKEELKNVSEDNNKVEEKPIDVLGETPPEETETPPEETETPPEETETPPEETETPPEETETPPEETETPPIDLNEEEDKEEIKSKIDDVLNYQTDDSSESSERSNTVPLETEEPSLQSSAVNWAKIAFFTSLSVFVIVIGIVLYFSFLKPTNNQNNDNIATVTPTVINSSFCFINGEELEVGESFTANDGCNLCTCENQGVVSCTEKECEATSSSAEKITPTKAATASSTPSTTPVSTKSANPTLSY